jgi:hypothetical protein
MQSLRTDTGTVFVEVQGTDITLVCTSEPIRNFLLYLWSSACRFPVGIELLFATMSRPSQGPTHPSIQWVPAVKELKREGDYLPVLKLIMCGDIPPLPRTAHGAVFKHRQPYLTLNLCRGIEPATHSTGETQTREAIRSCWRREKHAQGRARRHDPLSKVRMTTLVLPWGDIRLHKIHTQVFENVSIGVNITWGRNIHKDI